MNQNRQLPRRRPDERRLIQYFFPEYAALFWGPNQDVDPNKYNRPSGFFGREVLINPKVVRFIHDSGERTVEESERQCIYSRTIVRALVGRNFVDGPPTVDGTHYWNDTLPQIGEIYPDSTEFMNRQIPLQDSPGHFGRWGTIQEVLDADWHAYWWAFGMQFWWKDQHGAEFAFTTSSSLKRCLGFGMGICGPPPGLWNPKQFPQFEPITPYCPEEHLYECPCGDHEHGMQ